MKYIGVISVRLMSSRLPQKALLPIGGRRVIEHVIDRAKVSLQSGLLHNIVVCTSTNPEDDILEIIARNEGVDYFRGSLEDKLDRWLKAAEYFGADGVVTLDGDDLFCDPELIALAVAQLEEHNLDVVTGDVGDFISGAFTHIIKTAVLRTICDTKGSVDTEMTKPYLLESNLFQVAELAVEPLFHNPEIRLTLDYPDDYLFFKRVFEQLPIDVNIKPLRKILEFLDKNPDIRKINIDRQAEFRQNQKNKESLILKQGNV